MHSMGMRVFGSSHRRAAPSALQNLVARKAETLATLLAMQSEGRLRGAVLLGTCNRLEVVIDAAEFEADLPQRLFPGAEITLHDHHDADATEYLLRVATGLESMVLGEEQILGQLRDAFKTAESHGLLSPALRVLRTRLVAAARDTRAAAGLARCNVSVASLAARQLTRAGRRFVILGAGETGRLAVETLVKRGFTDLLIVNRTRSRAEGLARHFGGRAASLREFLDPEWRASQPAFDGMLCAIASPQPIVDAELLKGAQMVVDVSMPSVLDDSVRSAQDLEVLDLDGIAQLVNEEGTRRENSADVASELVRAKARTLHDELEAASSGQGADLGKIVEQHIEAATRELQSMFASQLRHLSDTDQEHVRRAVLRAAKHNAHLHVRDVRELTRT